jgi:hypothetical protein
MKNAIICFAATAALVVACNHEDAPARSANTTGAFATGNQDAVKRLTEARCERAKACNQLGEKQKYADEAACKRENHHDLEADLRPGECPAAFASRSSRTASRRSRTRSAAIPSTRSAASRPAAPARSASTERAA